jgi:hypothetical protein
MCRLENSRREIGEDPLHLSITANTLSTRQTLSTGFPTFSRNNLLFAFLSLCQK